MDNHNTFLGILGSTSAVDNLVLSIKRPGDGAIVWSGVVYRCHFPIAQVMTANGIRNRVIHTAFPRLISKVSSDLSEPKKKTKRGRR